MTRDDIRFGRDCPAIRGTRGGTLTQQIEAVLQEAIAGRRAQLCHLPPSALT